METLFNGQEKKLEYGKNVKDIDLNNLKWAISSQVLNYNKFIITRMQFND